MPNPDLKELCQTIRERTLANETRFRRSREIPQKLLPRRLLPRRIEDGPGVQDGPQVQDGPEADELGPAVLAWLKDKHGPAVAILASEMGAGKTVATSQLPFRICRQLDADGDSGSVLWIPCSDINWFDKNPNSALLDFLAMLPPQGCPLPDLWGNEAKVRLVILDGVDEFLSTHDRERHARGLEWLRQLLNRLRSARATPRFLISGRDVVLGESFINPQISELLSYMCVVLGPAVPDANQRAPKLFRLLALDDKYLRRTLERWLLLRSQGLAETIVKSIRPGLLSSPVLYGYAVRLLEAFVSNEIPLERLREIDNEFDLTAWWIERLLMEDTPRVSAPASVRREAAQAIALHLTVSGTGAAGLTLDEIREIADSPGLSINPCLFANDCADLRNGCLLRERGGARLSLFNDSLTIHLAAEGLHRLITGGDESGGAPPPPDDLDREAPSKKGGATLLREMGAWWALARLVNQSHLSTATRLESFLLHNGRICDPGPESLFAKAAHYYAQFPLIKEMKLDQASMPELPALELPVLGEGKAIPPLLGVAVLFRNVLQRAIQSKYSLLRAHEVSADLIRQLYVQGPGDLRLCRWNTPATSPVGQVAEACLAVLPGSAWPPGRDGKPRQFEISVLGADGSLTSLNPQEPLRKCGVRSGDTLFLWPEGSEDQMEIVEGDWLSIPPGSAMVWSYSENVRRIKRIEIPAGLYLATELVSVGEFAEFLRANHFRLPSQPDVGWKEEAGGIQFNPGSSGKPVSGISQIEATQYVKWLNARLGEQGIRYALPEPEWLQVAAQGHQLEDLAPEGNGPFGHRSLTGVLWQWTNDVENQQTLAFGGSEQLASRIVGSAQQALVRGWPNLCRVLPAESRIVDVGFRICLFHERQMT